MALFIGHIGADIRKSDLEVHIQIYCLIFTGGFQKIWNLGAM
jgi:hypothetical protein